MLHHYTGAEFCSGIKVSIIKHVKSARINGRPYSMYAEAMRAFVHTICELQYHYTERR